MLTSTAGTVLIMHGPRSWKAPYVEINKGSPLGNLDGIRLPGIFETKG